MFDIRVICEPADTERAITALSGAFTISSTRQYPTRDGKRARLYVTAALEAANSPWPTPEDAYDRAPSIVSEITWIARTARDITACGELEREYHLRKAAALDRIALTDEPDRPHGPVTETALAAALYLLDLDHTTEPADPRGYVREQYRQWREHQHRAELIADGRCPNCAWPDHQCNCADHPDA